MPRATRHADMPPEPDLGAIAGEAREALDRTTAVIGRLEKIADAGEAGAPFPPGLDAHGIALLIKTGRQEGSSLDAFAGQLARISLEGRLADACLAAERAEGRQEGAGAARGHRRARPGRGPGEGRLELLPGGRATAIKGAAAVAAIAAGVTLTTGGYSDLAHYSPAATAAHHRVLALDGVAPVRARPVSAPSQRAYIPRHAKPSADAASASPVPSPPVSPRPPPRAPSPEPSAAPAGILDVATVAVSIGPGGHGQITFSAIGGTVSWSASSSSPALSFSQPGGDLGDRQPGILDVTVARGSAAGMAVVTLSAGGRQVSVPVTWAAVPGLAA